MLSGSITDLYMGTGFAFIIALIVSLAAGAWLIRFFQRKNVIEDTTQPDHEGLNAIQSQKKNVPTMGGLMILAGIIIAALLCIKLRSPQVWIGILVVIVLGGAGFADDYIKLKHRPSRGLTKTEKLAIQSALGAIVGCLLILGDGYIPEVWMPFAGWCQVGWWYVPWCGLVIAATSNAVNLTDGLDGLAGGLMLLAAAAMIFLGPSFRTVGMNLHEPEINALILCAAMAGGVLGFLWYNSHPAKIFMGDTGSLALGGLFAYIALVMQIEVFLLAFGAVFFINELTVAMQIVSFKLTGRRIFPITPIHHHFQVNLKWPEQKIVVRAWMLGIVLLVLSNVLVYVYWSWQYWNKH